MSTHAVHVDEISAWSWVAIAVFAWLLVALLLLAWLGAPAAGSGPAGQTRPTP